MDIKFENSDIKLANSGDCIYVGSVDEAAQIVRRAVLIKKGSFIYDKNLGTEIRELDTGSSTYLKTVTMLINEALVNYPDISAKATNFSLCSDGSVSFEIMVYYKNQSKNTEVIVGADL
ncbi:MAG: hypothetical protein E7532_02005 [Ruminococcaceae bacterium]|nr:hypothetical protein [Oscillospiraceae bacterium]